MVAHVLCTQENTLAKILLLEKVENKRPTLEQIKTTDLFLCNLLKFYQIFFSLSKPNSISMHKHSLISQIWLFTKNIFFFYIVCAYYQFLLSEHFCFSTSIPEDNFFKLHILQLYFSCNTLLSSLNLLLTCFCDWAAKN